MRNPRHEDMGLLTRMRGAAALDERLTDRTLRVVTNSIDAITTLADAHRQYAVPSVRLSSPKCSTAGRHRNKEARE